MRCFAARFVGLEKLLDRREVVLDRLLHDLVHRRARALQRLVVALAFGRVDDRRRKAAAEEEQVQEQARDLAAVLGEGERAEQIVVRTGGEPHRRACALRLRIVDPVDDVPHLVRDFVGRGVLVEVEAMLRHVLAVTHGLHVAFLGVQDQVDLLHGVDRDRHLALVGRLVADEVERLAVAADLLDHRLHARVDLALIAGGIDRGAELLDRVDGALERAVVIDPRHVEVLAVGLLERLVRGVKTRLQSGRALLERERLRRRRRRRRSRGEGRRLFCHAGSRLRHGLRSLPNGFRRGTSTGLGLRNGLGLRRRLRFRFGGRFGHGPDLLENTYVYGSLVGRGPPRGQRSARVR